MDNKQPRNPNDLLIIQNIDTEDFEWYYDTIKTPLPYYIRAGETRKLPFFIAKHGVEKLTDKILQKEGKLWTNPLLRAEVMDKIILGVEHINTVREKTANEIALEEMQRKKDIDPVEELLKKREIDAEKQRENEAVRQQVAAAPVTQVQGVKPGVVVAPTIDPEATDRIGVYKVLTEKLHMDLTHPATKEKLDSLSVEKIKSDFSSDVPEWAAPGDPNQITAPIVGPTKNMEPPLTAAPPVAPNAAPVLNQVLQASA